MQNIIEKLRQTVVNDLFKTKSFRVSYEVWKNEINRIIGPNPSASSILDLGDHLSEIFNYTGGGNRSQSDVSSGGTAWECLVTWYLNLCFIGTRTVAIKKMSQVPTPVKDSITVNYSNFSCSTESDITVLVFPDLDKYTKDPSQFLNRNNNINKKKLSDSVGDDFVRFQIGIVQCKTNWNDNAQIPMLWDMIYSAGGFGARQISVGINNFSIRDIQNFTYSFVTVPTNRLSSYNPSSVSVKRVYNLTGGNYWGYPTSIGIARSLKEIFNNYRDGYQQGVIRNTLTENINEIPTKYDYFNLFNE